MLSLLLLFACSDSSLAVAKSAPSLTIVSPADGASFMEGEPFTITVDASDRETPTDQLSLYWSLDDGTLLEGTTTVDGDTVSLALDEGLGVGNATITVVVTDADALSDEDSVVVVVLGYETDGDGDGYDDPLWGGDDCDDDDPDVHPDAPEACDGEDDDCDDEVDEDATVDTSSFYADTDGDGYGDAANSIAACDAPDGYVANATDCDDTDGTTFPGAAEVCDGEDDDCDGAIDEEATDASTWYADLDADGYGDAATGVGACDAPEGHVADATDCDDADPDAFPGAPEVCDGEDDDCDGAIDDDAIDGDTWHADADTDGYGDPGVATSACSAPAGWVADATDCDDTDAAASPAGTEVCDGDDDDCDGTVDEASAVDASTWYRDSDGDGYGDPARSTTACTPASGYVADATDCDDGDDEISPAAEEVCDDGVDQDCDGDDPVCPIEGTVGLGEATARLYGASSWMQVGAGVGACGDLDDDGLDDLIVSGDDTTDAGDAWVFFSDASGDLSTSDADVHLPGDDSSDEFAKNYANMSGGEDLNGDGVDDLVVGANGDDLVASSSGTAFVFYGPLVSGTIAPEADADYLWAGASANDYAGASVAVLADMTGDRYGELVVGAYGQDTGGAVAGAAYVNFGPFSGYRSSGTSLSGSDVVLTGEDATDYFGWSVADAGDWDGDGLTDVIVGAYGDDDGGSEAGAVYVFVGLSGGTVDASAAEYKLRGEASGDRLGWDVSGAGDTNGDGYADLAVGAYKNDDGGTDAGAAYVVTGNRSGTGSASSFPELYGSAAGDYAAYSLSAGGDVDGDGTPDLLVGAWKNDEAATDAGTAYLCYGPFSGGYALASADALLTGEDTVDYAGSSVSMVGDTDADGTGDLLVGAFGANAGATSAGAAYLMLGVGR